MRTGTITLAMFLLLGSVISTDSGRAAEADQPHPHQGILKPYEPIKPTFDLDAEQLERLAKGKLEEALKADDPILTTGRPSISQGIRTAPPAPV